MYYVKEPELWESSRMLYSSVLADTVSDHRASTEDLARLVALKWTLGLGPQDIAACHQNVGSLAALLFAFCVCLFFCVCVLADPAFGFVYDMYVRT